MAGKILTPITHVDRYGILNLRYLEYPGYVYLDDAGSYLTKVVRPDGQLDYTNTMSPNGLSGDDICDTEELGYPQIVRVHPT